MNIAIIPARGGSKRIPRKNIKDFGGRPMIAWSIEAACKSECFDRIIVSTDDIEIARVAEKYNAEVPFMRPATLADDHTGTIPVIAHAIEWLQAQGEIADTVCCLYATAPFVTTEALQKGYRALCDHADADYAFAVTSYAFPIQRALRKTANGRVEMFQPEHFSTRSQDLEEAWHDAGQFYWGRAEAWQAGRTLFGQRSIPVPMPRHRVQDIDSPEDWQRAEWLMRVLNQEDSNS
ncbi:pseudaminic acid cytidylyltransferase [Franzmannia qiaohouensis]|uniref:Pseudaminic acid cytidylyltransferase n=1 Tax=Franzmannia qiaohouensis TaxID=1329370 RepID=A0ABU1HJ41_9GAMM|nr:pseudaminic acid cytidylyltransferase [Halomonas qiaohouensis]MDR5907506.1 pseudaminic acid cytidylyltransferase [Halomonas qiaohouensis]